MGYDIIGKTTKVEGVFLADLKQIVERARARAYAAVNFAQVESNWLIGQRIVEQEQKGKDKAEYGKRIIALVSDALTKEFGKGYSKTNVKNFKRFYLEFQDIGIGQTVSAQLKGKGQALPDQLRGKGQTVSDQLEKERGNAVIERGRGKGQALPAILSWSHYERLMRISNKEARNWYMRQAADQMWTFRTLDRNISTQYYERLLSSQMNNAVEEEMKEKTEVFQMEKLAFIKNPTVLEFLGLASNLGHTEQDIEKAILSNLQSFIMEMGNGFAFVARQELIRTESKDYFVDLVFYNYILKCFVLIDLKIGQVTHQDVGQMDMYVRMYDEMKRTEGDNPTIGIVLCSETDKDIARYSILKGNEQLFATKYQLYLPTVKQLQDEVERQTEIIKQQLLQEAEVRYGK